MLTGSDRRWPVFPVLLPFRPSWCRPDSSPPKTRSTMMSSYRGCITRQTTVRLPDELADEAVTVAGVHGTSVNQLIIHSLSTEIDRVRSDADFMSRARRLLERDQAIIDRLAE